MTLDEEPTSPDVTISTGSGRRTFLGASTLSAAGLVGAPLLAASSARGAERPVQRTSAAVLTPPRAWLPTPRPAL